jgi:two-component system, sporulation sensor kinase A
MSETPNPATPLEELTTLRSQVAQLQQRIDDLKEVADAAKRLQMVLMNMPAMIDAFDADGNIVLWNHECERVTGYSAGEVIGNPHAMELMSPNQAYREQKMREWKELGDNYRGLIWEMTAKDGSVKTVAWSNISARVPITPWKTWGIGVDITEQSGQEKTLRESEERFRSLFENAPDGLLIADADTGRFRMANRAICQMTGYDSHEITQLSIRDIHPEENVSEELEAFERGVRCKVRVRCNVPLKTRDGRVIYVDIHGIDLEMDGIPRIMGVFRDVTEQRKSEKALQESEERFRSIFENAPDGFLIADVSTGQFRMANKAICDMTGYTPHEITQLGVRDIHPEESLPHVRDVFEKMVRGELDLSHNIPVKTKDGRILCVDVRAIHLNLNGIPFAMGVFRDVTEQRRATEAIAESERVLRDVFENLSVGLYHTDPLGRVLMANPAFVRMLGYSSFEELARQNTEDLYLNSHYPRLAFREKIEKDGRVLDFESAWTRLDGSVLHTIENARVVRDREGRVLYYEGTIQDITQRVRMEAAVRESENKYRTLVESAGETIAVIDKEGVYLFMNTTCADRHGGTPDEYTGKTQWDLFPPEIADRQMTYVRTVIQTGRGMSMVVPTVVRGMSRWYNTTIEPLSDANGQIHSALIVGRDISDLRQAQKELEEYRTHMAHAERLASLGTLSATVAHELNQPLTVIKLMTQNSLAQLERNDPAERIIDDLKECLKAVSTATSIVDHFKSFARHSTSREASKTDLRRTVEKAARLWEDAAATRKVRIAMEGLDRPWEIDAPEVDMEQVFFCLMQNAIQAASGTTDHRLLIRGIAKDASIELHFIDDCGGIAPEHMDKLFEPFFTTKGHRKGTGLGLPIVEHILSRLGGRIQVENRPGQGVTFIVALPVRRRE